MKYKLSEIALFNPTETLKKGTLAKKVGMDKLQSFCRDIPDYEIAEFSGGTKFRNGDTIMARITPCLENGKTAKVNILNTEEVGFGSTEYIVFRAIDGVTDEDYLYYLVCSPIVRDIAIKSMVGSSGRQRVQTDVVKGIEIELPTLDEQRKIGSLLKSLDDKIAVNNKINENLEQQIEAIFNNKYAPSLCCPNWVVGTIGDVVPLQRGYDLPRDKMVSGSYPVAGSTDTIFYHNEYTTEAPCVVMGRSGNIGKPRLYMERCWAHNTTLIVKDFKGNNPYWSYYMIRSIDYSQFRGGSAVPTLNRNHVHSFEISIPPVNQQNEFAEIILPLLLLIENNRKEIKRLSTLRQALLPKLMAGEIDISDIDL